MTQEIITWDYANWVMQLSIFAITILPLPEHPGGFAPNICPHPGAFASQLLPGGQGFVGVVPEGRAFVGVVPEGRAFVGVVPEGRAFVHKRFLPFLEFSL